MFCICDPMLPIVNGTSYCTITVFLESKYDLMVLFYGKILGLEEVAIEETSSQGILLSNG